MFTSALDSLLSTKLDRKAVDSILLFVSFVGYWFMLFCTLMWLAEHWKVKQEVPSYERSTGLAESSTDNAGDNSSVSTPSL